MFYIFDITYGSNSLLQRASDKTTVFSIFDETNKKKYDPLYKKSDNGRSIYFLKAAW